MAVRQFKAILALALSFRAGELSGRKTRREETERIAPPGIHAGNAPGGMPQLNIACAAHVSGRLSEPLQGRLNALDLLFFQFGVKRDMRDATHDLPCDF